MVSDTLKRASVGIGRLPWPIRGHAGPASGGAPDLSPCSPPFDPKGYLRLRPAGAKLKVEYTYEIRPDRRPYVAASRGYLHR
jgi:hypothetical protein